MTENSLARVLNAVAWKLHDAHEAKVNGWSSSSVDPLTGSPELRPHSSGETPITTPGIGAVAGSDELTATKPDNYVGYVQGMNVLAAPFLYAAKSEVQAFVGLVQFVQTQCPAYIRGSMEGVHRGLKLVDEVLSICDPKLYNYLSSKGLNASIYAFPSVLTMCACTAPLPEVLQLWDFLLAYGVHLNILCVVAQMILIRDQLLVAERYVPKDHILTEGLRY